MQVSLPRVTLTLLLQLTLLELVPIYLFIYLSVRKRIRFLNTWPLTDELESWQIIIIIISIYIPDTMRSI